MKFTEEQAVEALRAELTNKGRKTLAMSPRTLTNTVKKLMSKLADEDTGLPDFIEDTLEVLTEIDGNVRRDKSDNFRKIKEELSTTDPVQDPEPPKPAEDPALKAYEERIAALEKRLAEADTRSVLAQKRSDLVAKLKEKGVKDEKWIEKYLSKVNINADTDVESEVEDTLSLYNLNRANGGSAVPPANPSGASPNIENDMSDVVALAKQRNESMKQ